MIMPAMGPPPKEELFFALVEPEEDPSLLPPELELDVGDDINPVLVNEIVFDVTWELEDVAAAEEPDRELELPAEVEVGVVESDVIELELGAVVVVEASGPAFAA
jgi:hypothetical protein